MTEPIVSSAEVAAYVDAGFLVMPDLVSDTVVRAVRDELGRFASGDLAAADHPGPGTEILAVHFPHWASEVVAEVVVHRGVAEVVSAIAGAHLAHWTGDVKCMQSMLFMKPPGLPGQAWHQDERFIPTRDRSLVGAWIALDDATVDNGCLWVLPGSHQAGYLWPTRGHGRPEEFDPTDEAYGFDDSAAVAVEVAAGDVVFFNGYLLHRSLRNRSNVRRRALVNHYMSAASLLPWMVSDQFDAATADQRCVVPLGHDPYAWKGYADPPRPTFVRPHEGPGHEPDRPGIS